MVKSQNRLTSVRKIAKSVDQCSSVSETPPSDSVAVEERIVLAKEKRWLLKKAVEDLLPNSRTARCCRFTIPIQRDTDGNLINRPSNVGIYRSIENGSTFYGGLETCSSVWCCPICAAKISERRRQELLKIWDIWKSQGGKVYLFTLTFPHGSYDILSDLQNKFSKARKKLFSSKGWRKWKEKINLCHHIYTLEVTYGIENGWHIHLHCALFIMPTPDTEIPLASDILPTWQRSCISSGLGKPNDHGVDISEGESANNYISKWGLDLELTKQHSKHGREGHRTPFDLLRAYADGDLNAGLLFREFARAFKGKRHIVMSRGLRQALGMGLEKTDKELAQEDVDKAVCIATLTIRQWDLVLKHDLRFSLLEIARLEGSEGVRKALKILSSA